LSVLSTSFVCTLTANVRNVHHSLVTDAVIRWHWCCSDGMV